MSDKLVRSVVSPFGDVWVPKRGEAQVAHLGSEVAEYFGGGIALRRGDVVLDIGANVGVFAMHAATVADDLTIVCAEPIPLIFQALERNFATHGALRKTRHELVRAGITEEREVGEMEFTYFERLPCDSTRHMDEKRRQFERFFAALGSRARTVLSKGGLPGRIAGAGIERVIASLPKGPVGQWASDRALGATSARAPMITVDTLVSKARVDRVDLLKIDVEGAEVDVLRGVSDVLWPRVRQVALEGHDENGRAREVKHLLESKGFTVDVSTPEIGKERGLDNFLAFARRSYD